MIRHRFGVADVELHVKILGLGYRVRLIDQRRAVLSDLFSPGMHKSAMVGVFLAVLELARHHNVQAEQHDIHGEIVITPGDAFDAPLMSSDVTSV